MMLSRSTKLPIAVAVAASSSTAATPTDLLKIKLVPAFRRMLAWVDASASPLAASYKDR